MRLAVLWATLAFVLIHHNIIVGVLLRRGGDYRVSITARFDYCTRYNAGWLCPAKGSVARGEWAVKGRGFEWLFSRHTGEAVAFDFAQSTAVTILIVLVMGRTIIHFVFFVCFVVGFNPHHAGEWLKGTDTTTRNHYTLQFQSSSCWRMAESKWWKSNYRQFNEFQSSSCWRMAERQYLIYANLKTWYVSTLIMLANG
jgi:hypothetical protein